MLPQILKGLAALALLVLILWVIVLFGTMILALIVAGVHALPFLAALALVYLIVWQVLLPKH